MLYSLIFVASISSPGITVVETLALEDDNDESDVEARFESLTEAPLIEESPEDNETPLSPLEDDFLEGKSWQLLKSKIVNELKTNKLFFFIFSFFMNKWIDKER